MTHPSSPPDLTLHDGVATLCIRRPDKRNRLEPHDLRVLIEHCQRIDADSSVHVVVLTALTTGQIRPVFCSGYDIGGFEGQPHDTQGFEDAVQALANLRPIVIGALNGSVYGGATDMALACDLRVGLAGTEFRMPALTLGLHYYPSGLRRYVANMGLHGARHAFLTARALPVEHLHAQGVLLEVATTDTFDACVAALVADVKQLAPAAAQATKRSLRDIALGCDDEATLAARLATSLRSPDFAEGRLAFAQRRRPVFGGD